MTKTRISKPEQYISQYRTGMSIRKIAVFHKVTENAVRQYLRANHTREYRELSGSKQYRTSKRYSERLNEVMSFIVGYKRQHDGCSPSIRQIIANTSYTSNSTIVYALQKLERQGKIIYASDYANGRGNCRIMVVGGEWTYSANTAEARNSDTD